MKTCNRLFITALSLFRAFTVLAQPVEVLRDSLPQRRHQACEPIGTYTTEWFLSTTMPGYEDVFNNTALFYTRGLTSRAVSYAAAHSLTTIWSVWPCYLYNHINSTDNPMRCIHNDESKRKTFYENMSRAFAKKANGSVLVMHSEDDYSDPPLDGIWGRVELPTLKSGEGVSRVAKIKDDGSEHKVVWKRRNGKEEQERMELKKRNTDAGPEMACMRLAQYDWYNNVDW